MISGNRKLDDFIAHQVDDNQQKNISDEHCNDFRFSVVEADVDAVEGADVGAVEAADVDAVKSADVSISIGNELSRAVTLEDGRGDQHSDPTTQSEFNLRTENELRKNPADRCSKGRLSESFKRLSDRISIVTRFKRQTTVCSEGQVRKISI
jgi:hypothetical protein